MRPGARHSRCNRGHSNVRRLIAAFIGVALLASGTANAQTAKDAYPNRPVRMVVPFAAGGPGLVTMWYGMFASALIFTAIPTLTRKLFPERSTSLDLGVTFGVLAGLVQALGFARWVFLVPALAATNADPSSSEAIRAAVGVVFDAFNRYAGIGVGEHLGYLFTALWTLSIAFALLQRSRLLGVTGAVFAIGILAGLLEPFGFGWAGSVNAIAYIAWSVWMVAFGITIWRAAKPATINR